MNGLKHVILIVVVVYFPVANAEVSWAVTSGDGTSIYDIQDGFTCGCSLNDGTNKKMVSGRCDVDLIGKCEKTEAIVRYCINESSVKIPDQSKDDKRNCTCEAAVLDPTIGAVDAGFLGGGGYSGQYPDIWRELYDECSEVEFEEWTSGEHDHAWDINLADD